MMTRIAWSLVSFATLAMCQSLGKNIKNSLGVLSKKRAFRRS